MATPKKINMADLLAKIRKNKEAESLLVKEESAPIPSIETKSIMEILCGSTEESPEPTQSPPPTELTPAESIRANLAIRLAALKKDKEKPLVQSKPEPSSTELVESVAHGMHGEAIMYNAEQQEFIDTISAGKSCVLVGAAGTGKTTCSQGGIAALIASDTIPVLQAGDHKFLKSGTPGIIIIAFTRRAVNNSRKVQSNDFKSNCITAHKLLEYQPIYFEIADPETGDIKKTMRFEPTRDINNPLPNTIHTIIVEEASMLSEDLFLQIVAACPHEVQWVFIGDIQQLPPVFGSAILGFKMLELPVIELTHVYRQALESPIIRLAHRILSGKPIPTSEFDSWKEEGKLTIRAWKKKLSPEDAVKTLSVNQISNKTGKMVLGFFPRAIESGDYDPDEDMILMPFNKACGTLEINSNIANYLARKREAVTYEVIAGYNKYYFSAGDKVLYDKEDAEIVSIETNPIYVGAKAQKESKYLDYWGHNPNAMNESEYDSGDSDIDVDFLLDAVAVSEEDRVTQASHSFVIRLLDTERDITICKAADINGLLHSYALTVHKSQGSEWRKVFLCLHQSHATMLQRELLYTAVTRAREELYIICEPESLTKGIISQRIKGDTLAEKAEWFKGKRIEQKAQKTTTD